MSSPPIEVRFRLSKSQMSYIWPGIDVIVKGYSSHREGKSSQFCYPFQLYPPAPGFNRGEYNAELMSQIIGLWKRLRPKAQKGGRVQMDAIEIRAAIFAIRVNLDRSRYLKQRLRNEETKRRFEVEPESLRICKAGAGRVIRSLERHLKRSNCRLRSQVGKEGYDALMSVWKAHLRWVRLRLVYFKPWKIHRIKCKKWYQEILNELERIARIALRAEGYEQPEAKELRRVMRLFTSSSRRGRQFPDFHYVLRHESNNAVRYKLAEFVLQRLHLKPIPGT